METGGKGEQEAEDNTRPAPHPSAAGKEYPSQVLQHDAKVHTVAIQPPQKPRLAEAVTFQAEF